MCIRINHAEKALVCSKTADIVRPPCFDTLVLYCSYLEQRGRAAEAKEELKAVFKGEKRISALIEKAQKHHLI